MNTDTEFKAQVNKKKIATSGIAYFCSFLYFLIVILIVSTIIGVVIKNNFIWIASLATIGVSIICLVVIDLNYYWFLNEKLIFKSNKIIFTYDEVISSFGHTTVKDEILRLDTYKIKKNKILLFGEIKHSEPMMRPKVIKKVDIPKNFEKYDDLIKLLDSYKRN